MLGTLIVLAPLFSELPKAVLAAIIIDAVVFGMIDIAELRRLYRVTRFDFWIAVAAILGVLSAGVLAGVVIGIVLSLGWLIYVATQPPMPLLGREPDTQVFRDIQENPDDQTFAGIAVLRLDGGLFFATAEALENRIRALVDDSASSARARPRGRQLRRLAGLGEARRDPRVPRSRRRRIPARARQAQVLAVLRADGVVDRIGTDHIHGNVHRAVEAELAASGAQGSPTRRLRATRSLRCLVRRRPRRGRHAHVTVPNSMSVRSGGGV